MATIICPLCNMANSTKNRSCTACNESLPQTESSEETSSEPIPTHDLPDASSVVLCRGNRLYHAYRDMDDLYFLHLGDASSSVTASELRTWNADNWKRRFGFFVLTKSLIPGGGILGLLIFVIIRFGDAFKKDEIDLAYVFGPMILIVLGIVYVIIRHQRVTWSFVNRLIEHDHMDPSARREAAERSPNFLFSDSTLQHVQLLFDQGDQQKNPKWFLVVHDTQKKETRFEIFTKDDRIRLRAALGDFVEADQTSAVATKTKVKNPVSEKLLPPGSIAAIADDANDKPMPDPDIWFFGMVYEFTKADVPPVPKAYRFYPSEDRIYVIPAPGLTRVVNTRAAIVWGVIGCIAILLFCGLTYDSLAAYSEKNAYAPLHAISAFSGLAITLAIGGAVRRVIMVGRQEQNLDEMTPEDLVDQAVNTSKYRPILVRGIVECVLDSRNCKNVLELKDFKGKKHTIQLLNEIDVKIAKKACRSRFPDIFRVRKDKKRKSIDYGEEFIPRGRE